MTRVAIPRAIERPLDEQPVVLHRLRPRPAQEGPEAEAYRRAAARLGGTFSAAAGRPRKPAAEAMAISVKENGIISPIAATAMPSRRLCGQNLYQNGLSTFNILRSH